MDTITFAVIAAIFCWTGFVRTGLGFGGAALGLPLLLIVDPDPLFWLPIIGSHLLFFSGMTLRTRIADVDWHNLRLASYYIIPPAIIGVFGLITLPALWLTTFIYVVTMLYALMWLNNWAISSSHRWIDNLLLLIGGYIAGTSLTGAPLIVAVFLRRVAKQQLRNTLFVLWFTLVTLKMATFLLLGVELHLLYALYLLPVAAVGHYVGLRYHERILQNDAHFKRWIGGGLLLVSALGLFHLVW